MEVPLILTLAIEENAFQFFNALRNIYFPAERNYIDAHLTLFHLLPNEPSIIDTVELVAKGHGDILLHVKEPSLTGNGVVYTIESDELVRLHKCLQEQWNTFLIPQDQQQLWPHITVQNKVEPGEATELLQFLNENFCAFYAKGTGLQVWEYNSGPWKLFKQFNFIKN